MPTLLQRIFGMVPGAAIESNPLVQGVESTILSKIASESPTLSTVISLAGLFAPAAHAPASDAIITTENFATFELALDDTLTQFSAPTSADAAFQAALVSNLVARGISVPPAVEGNPTPAS